MTLKIIHLEKTINPFDVIECPLCDGTEFTSVDHASVWCDECNAEFFVRDTAGDPGFVVDCRTGNVDKARVKRPEILEKGLYSLIVS